MGHVASYHARSAHLVEDRANQIRRVGRDVLPADGARIDAWPPGVGLAQLAPIRGALVLRLDGDELVLEGGQRIDRRSAWRLAEGGQAA